MHEKLDQNIRNQIESQVRTILEESWTMIRASMDRAAHEASVAGKDALRFPISLRASLEPVGSECAVSVSISWGTRCKLSVSPVLVSDQKELPLKP